MVARSLLSLSALCRRPLANVVASSARKRVADLFAVSSRLVMVVLIVLTHPRLRVWIEAEGAHLAVKDDLAEQCRVQVLQDIVNVFDAHGEPDAALCDAHR